MLKSLNHPNILHFIGILYKENKVLVLITGKAVTIVTYVIYKTVL